MLKALLQGKPFGHPLHPALVHFPIGLFLLTLALDVGSFFDPAAGTLARYTMGLGLLTGALAGVAGFADRSDIRLDHPSRPTVNTHMTLNLTALALFGINFLLRPDQASQTGVPVLYVLLSLAGTGILLVSGYLGGTMVYDNGIAVGRHRRYTRTPHKTIDVSVFRRQDGWAVVGGDDLLKDGETLRLELDGDVIALARQSGKLYAFQEFCTHRYGPLSEGKLEEHQVICPWHLSCFDMRTGKVVKGPAKVDLKTYSVEVREGKILVR